MCGFFDFLLKNLHKTESFFCFIISELKTDFEFRGANKSRARNIFRYLKPFVPSFRNLLNNLKRISLSGGTEDFDNAALTHDTVSFGLWVPASWTITLSAPLFIK